MSKKPKGKRSAPKVETSEEVLIEFLNRLFPYSDLPSTDRSRAWIHAHSPMLKASDETDRMGKWCIFEDAQAIDDAWTRVSEAVKAGRLMLAKVSTAMGFHRHRTHVICVYTRDWSDRDDMMAAREILREIGFTQPLKYKRDLETVNRVYGGADEFYLEA